VIAKCALAIYSFSHMQLEFPHLTGTLGAQILVGSEDDLPVIESAYVGSEFADLIAADLFNVLLVTNIESSEALRVCGEADVVAILYTNGLRPKASEIRKATELGLTVLATSHSLKVLPALLKAEFPGVVLHDAT